MSTQGTRPAAGGTLPQGFRHAGISYELLHLRAYETSYARPAEDGKPPIRFTVAISFSHHCFTRGLPIDDQPYDSTLLFTHLNEVRLFDRRRWHLSKQLPGIIEKLPDCVCQHANNANFLTVVFVDEDGTRTEYEVYFRVRKTGKGRLWLNVESAYVRDAEYFGDRPKGRRVKFYVILHNILNGKPIRS